MSDVNAPAAPAESSTAVLEVPTDREAYVEWRQTGKLPESKPAASAKEAQPKPEAPAASEKSEKPASEAGKKRSDAADRLNELLADLKNAGLTPAELKTFKREAKQAERAAETAERPKEAALPEKTEQPADSGRPKRPRMDDSQYKTVEDYEKALEKYEDELSDWKVEQKLKQRDAEALQREQQKTLNEKITAARQRYGEAADSSIKGAAQAIFTDKDVPNAVKALVDQSPVLVDLMYVLGSKAEDLTELVALAKSDPGAAIRKLVLLEQLVTEELKKPGGDKSAAPADSTETPGRDPSGKFVSPKKEPGAKSSEAPAPPAEVSGRGTVPADPVATAVKEYESGDGEAFRRYRNTKNREDLSHRRGR